MKRVIVSGANGFLGRALTSALVGQGIEVWAVVRDRAKMQDLLSEPLLSVVEAGFSDYQTMELPPDADVCIHLAWEGVFGKSYSDPRVQLTNCNAACSMAEQAARAGCRKMVFLESIHQYQRILMNGVIGGRVQTAYGISKAFAGQMCGMIADAYEMNYAAALLPNVFGEGDYSLRSTNTILLQLMEHVYPVLIPGEVPYDGIYVEDAVSGLIAVADGGGDGKRYYVGDRVIGTFREFAETMRDAVSPNMELSFGGMTQALVTDYSCIDLERTWEELKWEPTHGLLESMRKTAAWLKENRERFHFGISER